MEKFKTKEVHPMEKYTGEFIEFNGKAEPILIVDYSEIEGWKELEPCDAIFKECERYGYANIKDLI